MSHGLQLHQLLMDRTRGILRLGELRSLDGDWESQHSERELHLGVLGEVLSWNEHINLKLQGYIYDPDTLIL